MRAVADVPLGNREAALQALVAMRPSDDWLASYVAGTTLVDILQQRSGVPDPAEREAVARLLDGTRSRGKIPHVIARTAALESLLATPPSDDTRPLSNVPITGVLGRTDYLLLYAWILIRQAELERADPLCAVSLATAILNTFDARHRPCSRI